MPLPRSFNAAGLMPYLLGGPPPPYRASGIGDGNLESGAPASPLNPQGHILGNGSSNAGPFPSLRQPQPVMEALWDAPLGIASAPSPIDGPDGSRMGGTLMDTLPQLRLEDMPAKHGKGRNLAGLIMGVLGDGLLGYAGRPPVYSPAMMAEREGERDDNRFQQRLAAQIEAERQKYLAPRAEQVGNTVGWLDPSAKSFSPFFTAPSPAEQYASARGFEPGSPEYQAEVETYRLGSWSDPALEAKETLEGARFDNRKALQDDRLSTSRRNVDVRAGVTRRGQTLSDVRGRRGQDMTDKRGRESAGFRGRGKGSATPKAMLNGRTIVVRNGAWVDEATGTPVD